MMKKFISLICLWSFAVTLWAIPVRQVPREVQQPDGSKLWVVLRGDEHYHWMVTTDGYPVAFEKGAYWYVTVDEKGENLVSDILAHDEDGRTTAEKNFLSEQPDATTWVRQLMKQQKQFRSSPVLGNFDTEPIPSEGKVTIPVVLVEFKDLKFSETDAHEVFHQQMNGEGAPIRRDHGSVRSYFLDQSNGIFDPTFDVLGPVCVSREVSYYGSNDRFNNDANVEEMVLEAIHLLDADVNFKKYDNNGDGYVDAFYIVYAGHGESEWPSQLENTIWPHMSWISRSEQTNDGVYIKQYSCSNELSDFPNNELNGVGTFCHEFSHCLGLPDYYDTSGGDTYGMGYQSLMAQGCYNDDGHTPCGYTAFEKASLGWLHLSELKYPEELVLTPTSEGGRAYKIVNEANPDEFYVVENRQLTKWDEQGQGHGLMITHVDYDASIWDYNRVNTDEDHPRCTVIPADGILSYSTADDDLYPGKLGNHSLTPLSIPAAEVYTGGYMNKNIENIVEEDGIVRFSFMKGAVVEKPAVLNLVEQTPTSFEVQWTASDSVDAYEVNLYRLMPEGCILYENFKKLQLADSAMNIGGRMNLYTSHKGWRGEHVYAHDGALRVGNGTDAGVLESPSMECDSAVYTVFLSLKKCQAEDHPEVFVGTYTEGSMSVYGTVYDDLTTEWTDYAFVEKAYNGLRAKLYVSNDMEDTGRGDRFLIDNVAIYEGKHQRRPVGEEPLQKLVPQVRMAGGYAAVDGMEQCRQPKRMANRVLTSGIWNNEASTRERELLLSAMTNDTVYTFEALTDGDYVSYIRSKRENDYSIPSEEVGVTVENTGDLVRCASPSLEVDCDSIFLTAADTATIIYYTLDGSRPDRFATVYEGPIAAKDEKQLRAVAYRPGVFYSEIMNFDNAFVHEGMYYRYRSTVKPEVAVTVNRQGAAAGNVQRFVWSDTITHAGVRYAVTAIDDRAFCGYPLLMDVELESRQLVYVGDELFVDAPALSAVVWKLEQPIRTTMFAKKYSHLLVYVPEQMPFEHPLIGQGHMTVIRNGKGGALVLSDESPFYCPYSFEATSVSFDRRFRQQTCPGTAAGWETLVLPFDVQRIEHESDGAISPFGGEGTRHFWLARWEKDTFKAAQTIQANVPYVIAMPNYIEYGDHLLAGKVTFSATNCKVMSTDRLEGLSGSTFIMQPSYAVLPPAEGVYALNKNKAYGEDAPGSVFVPSTFTVEPFSAYMQPVDKVNAPRVLRMQVGQSGEEAPAEAATIEVRGNEVWVTLPVEADIKVYDLSGRMVCKVPGVAGTNRIAHLPAGCYLIDHCKICIK